MTDSKDLEAEIHPLRREGPGGPPAPPRRLSRCRALAFFLSLALCLLVVLVVSFVIPCPERPASRGTWRVELSSAVAYDFLATDDVNRDRVQDVLFLYKRNSSSNASSSCAHEGFSSPCTFMAAVSGASGSVLWERPAAQDAALAQCAVAQPRGRAAASACVLVGRPGPLLAVDTLSGQTLWQGAGGNAPVLSPPLPVPDLDADGAPDLLVLAQEGTEVSGSLYSGAAGRRLGPARSLGPAGPGRPVLYVTRTGAHYVLLPCASSLCGYSVKSLYETAGRDSSLRRDPAWEDRLDPATHRLPWRSPGAVRHVLLVPGRAGQDLFLVGTEACVLLDGQELAPRWTLEAAQVFRKPVLGRYKPDTVAVAVENGTGRDAQILLLDVGSGSELWRQALPAPPGGPAPASLPTADGRSAFFFWGRQEPAAASLADQSGPRHTLYLFHPTLPGVLLELTNVSAPIAASHVGLFETSRHAACVILTGPAGLDAPGPVSVAKHTVRDLVMAGRVVRTAPGGRDSDQAARDRLLRLRYRAEA